MSTRRYCRNCQGETLHDVYRDGLFPGEKRDGLDTLFSICTLGIGELFSDTWCECQCCGKKSKKVSS